MKKTNQRPFVISGLLFAAFVIFTVLLKVVDVQILEGNAIGFATVNGSFNGFIQSMGGKGHFWYEISETLGYCAIGVGLGFALFAGWQLIKGKSLKKVDPCLIALGCFYVLVVAFYAFFEVVIINYRPVLTDGEYEASYPSSHTVLAVCIFATAIFLFKRYLSEKTCRIASCVVILFMVVTVAARLLSGVHWITDIIGGLILSGALVSFYAGLYRKVC